jgi:hypothetical protein
VPNRPRYNPAEGDLAINAPLLVDLYQFAVCFDQIVWREIDVPARNG